MKTFTLILLLHVAYVNTGIVLVNSRSHIVYGETYKVTAYCNCVKCCGKKPSHPAYGITASGKRASKGTIAVDKKVIPLGSRVWIKGIGLCRAEDTGGAIKGKHIDVWRDCHDDALLHGVKYLNVRVLPN